MKSILSMSAGDASYMTMPFALSSRWNSRRHKTGETMVEEILGLGIAHIELGYDFTRDLAAGVLKMVREGALAVVSVLAPRCMEADAWATALMVAGPEAGAALAAQHGLAARLLWQDAAGAWQEKLSPAFQTMLE